MQQPPGCVCLPLVGTAPRAVLICLEVGLALRANLAAPVGVWLQRVHAMVPDPVRTGAPRLALSGYRVVG
jgi:hypothetical protein